VSLESTPHLEKGVFLMKVSPSVIALSSAQVDAYDRVKDDVTCPKCGRSHAGGKKCPYCK
jgi:hypothetical protein